MPENNRKHVRSVPPESDFIIFITTSENKKFKVKGKDLSKGGIGVIAESYDCYDEEYMVQIKAASDPDGDDLFSARGTMRWIQEEAEGIALGIQFDYLDDENETGLQAILDKCEAC